MMLRLLLASCLLFSSGSWAALNETWLDEFERFTRDVAKDNNLPGVAYVIVEKGEPAHIVTFGTTGNEGKPINEKTVFRLASVSKTFTAALMGILVEKDELNWQTPLAIMAPKVGFNMSDSGGLTLEHLIGQSSGYIPNAYDNLIEANYSVTRILNALADLKPICKPGLCYTYQNALFGVLNHYFDAKRHNYNQTLNRELLFPLSMFNTSVGAAPLLSGENWAKPHAALARDKFVETKVRNDYYKFPAAAGINTTITDLGKWLSAMLGEYPDVLSEALIEQLTAPRTRSSKELYRREWKEHVSESYYGLGWRHYLFDDQPLKYHSGWVKGYRAEIAFAPEQGVGFGILVNAETSSLNKITAEFWSGLFAQLETESGADIASAD